MTLGADLPPGKTVDSASMHTTYAAKAFDRTPESEGASKEADQKYGGIVVAKVKQKIHNFPVRKHWLLPLHR